MFKNGDFDVNLAERVLNSILIDGGYQPFPTSADFDKTRRQRHDFLGFDLVSLQASLLSCDGLDIDLVSYYGKVVTVSFNTLMTKIPYSMNSTHNKDVIILPIAMEACTPMIFPNTSNLLPTAQDYGGIILKKVIK